MYKNGHLARIVSASFIRGMRTTLSLSIKNYRTQVTQELQIKGIESVGKCSSKCKEPPKTYVKLSKNQITYLLLSINAYINTLCNRPWP